METPGDRVPVQAAAAGAERPRLHPFLWQTKSSLFLQQEL